MSEGSFLLALPAQSIAVRLLVGAVLAVLAARTLLHAGLRVPRVRVGAALVPTAAVLTILVVSLGAYRLPSLMIPSVDGGALLVPVEDTYAYLAPLALPALLGLWALIAGVRIVRRVWGVLRVSRGAASTLAAGEVPLAVRRSVRRVAARMELDAPPVGVVDGCPGGASVVGVRRPVIVLDAALVAELDEQELEGVIAHELAHIRRRDNLVALLLGVTRDIAFFVPGGRWALRQLLVEREIAADQLAVDTTRRPGALAGGLLKVLETARGGAACAALLPTGTLVRRVEHLVDDRPPPSRTRVGTELTALAATFAMVVGSAALLPRVWAGAEPDGGLGVLVTAPNRSAPDPQTPQPEPEARAFATYRNSAVSERPELQRPVVAVDDDPDEFRTTTLLACAAGENCRSDVRRATLALQPGRRVVVDEELSARWRARQMVETGEVLRIYWLSRLR